MSRLAAGAAVLVALGIAGAAQAPVTAPAVDLGGRLYRSVFSSGTGTLAPADLEKTAEPLRSRLARYLERRATFKSAYKSAPDDLAAVRSDAKRRVLERSIVALVEAPGIGRLAAEFVAAAPIAGSWEGLPDGPAAEAAYAEDVLKKDPASSLAPWLYVFIADRQRIAFECYDNQKDAEGMRAASRKYRAFVDRARAAADPIYAAIISDMEAQPFLYIKGAGHPRDYDPDT